MQIKFTFFFQIRNVQTKLGEIFRQSPDEFFRIGKYLFRIILLNILNEILKGETPKPGSYRGRKSNEPENSRITLMDLKNA